MANKIHNPNEKNEHMAMIGEAFIEARCYEEAQRTLGEFHNGRFTSVIRSDKPSLFKTQLNGFLELKINFHLLCCDIKNHLANLTVKNYHILSTRVRNLWNLGKKF